MENDRRTFIKGLFSLGAICLIPPLDILAYNNLKLNKSLSADIGTIITVAQFAIGAAKLFQGSSTSGISDLQIKLLQNISKQLEVVQKGITTILNNLEEIRKEIDQLDEKVVETLNNMSLQGNINRFDILMQTYSKYEDKEKFLAERKSDVITLKNEIRKHKDVLILFENYLNIPVLCSALYMEYNLMSILKEPESEIIPNIKSYQAYFQKMLYGEQPRQLASDLMFLKMALNSQIMNFKNLSDIFLTQLKIGNARYPVLGYYKYLFYVIPSNNSDLLELGLIEEHHQLCKINVKIDSRISTRQPDHIADGFNGSDWTNKKNISSLPFWSVEKDRIINEAKSRETEINRLIRVLYSKSSCFYAGNRALNFCQKFDLS